MLILGLLGVEVLVVVASGNLLMYARIDKLDDGCRVHFDGCLVIGGRLNCWDFKMIFSVRACVLFDSNLVHYCLAANVGALLEDGSCEALHCFLVPL